MPEKSFSLMRNTTLKGRLEHITFHNQENYYTIARLRTFENKNLVTILGYIPEPCPGESIKIEGVWETHPRFGEQLRFDSYEIILPATTKGIKNYLSGGFIKGLGPVTANRLINHFQDKTLEIIEKHPEKLTEVKGIGKIIAQNIVDSWRSSHAMRDLTQFLKKHGLKETYGARIYREYGENAVEILTENPYKIATDISGFGFYIADTLAQSMDIELDQSLRVKACILHLIERGSADGHVFIDAEQLKQLCESFFQIDIEQSEKGINELIEENELIMEDLLDGPGTCAIYTRELYDAEIEIAGRLKALLTIPLPVCEISEEVITKEVLEQLAIKLSDEQSEVLEGIFAHRAAVITGGPGTGKTTLIRSIAAVFNALGKKILLAAPTGRAARRLAELTRRKAATIHKLLGYNLADNSFEKDQDDPLSADAVIIDEASMVDILLMRHLLRAVPMTARIILVGDVFQLPSVGPGNVLADIINSQIIKTYELTTIFRQAQESRIIINAHRVRDGRALDFSSKTPETELSDFYFIEQNQPETIIKTIARLYSKEIPQKFNLDRVQDIQVLTPMHKGLVGTFNLNRVLQQQLNPLPVLLETTGGGFKINDKVMQLKNNYKKTIFNGEIGNIRAIDAKAGSMEVDFDGRLVAYESGELDELSLAYAITIHKSQGSEYPAVIIPLITRHYVMLQRNLLYTALTRGKKLVILIGTKKAITIALHNDKPRQRLSYLINRLRDL